jgi:3D (Asp-Asp-Asp) domain-containing protein/peptidoglycan hydrolase CwlO-like protein
VRLAGVAALVVAATCAMSTTGARAARPSHAQFSARERQVLYELYAEDTAIGRARVAANRAATEVADITVRLAEARHEATFAKNTLRSARKMLATRLAAWYRQGTPPDAVEIFLGASSLSSAIDQLKLWHSATHLDRSVIILTSTADVRYRRATIALASARRTAVERRAALEARVQGLQRVRAAKADLLASLRRQAHAAERQRIADLARRATRAAQRSKTLAPAPIVSDPTPEVQLVPAIESAPVRPGGTLVVSSTAYALPGHTASGLPVGQGICAVDPSVIPMGTRFDVPGYGSCVAADTGSAIIGDRIDVWVPTEGQAASWGRRDVTITFQ